MTSPQSELADHLRAVADSEALLPALERVGDDLLACFASGHVLWTLGNGGSAAAAQHLAGELVGRYLRERRPLPAVALTADGAVMTCIGNDYDHDQVFARQVQALARPGDVVLAFTSTGRSPNVVAALAAARARGARTVLLTGAGHAPDGGPASSHADHALVVPHRATARVQEVHELLLHLLSERIDRWAAASEPAPEVLPL